VRLGILLVVSVTNARNWLFATNESGIKHCALIRLLDVNGFVKNVLV